MAKNWAKYKHDVMSKILSNRTPKSSRENGHRQSTLSLHVLPDQIHHLATSLIQIHKLAASERRAWINHSWSAGVTLKDLFHFTGVLVESLASVGSDPQVGIGPAAFETFFHLDVAGFFELAQVS